MVGMPSYENCSSLKTEYGALECMSCFYTKTGKVWKLGCCDQYYFFQDDFEMEQKFTHFISHKMQMCVDAMQWEALLRAIFG